MRPNRFRTRTTTCHLSFPGILETKYPYLSSGIEYVLDLAQDTERPSAKMLTEYIGDGTANAGACGGSS